MPKRIAMYDRMERAMKPVLREALKRHLDSFVDDVSRDLMEDGLNVDGDGAYVTFAKEKGGSLYVNLSRTNEAIYDYIPWGEFAKTVLDCDDPEEMRLAAKKFRDLADKLDARANERT